MFTYQFVATLAAVLRKNLLQLLSVSGGCSLADGISPVETPCGQQLDSHPTFRLSSDLSAGAPGIARWWQPPNLLPPPLPRHQGRLTVS